METNYYFEDFTVKSYARFLLRALGIFRFIQFKDYNAQGKVALWRHDVDFSVHRALELARIEHAHGAKSTYFVLLHSDFYNLLESEVTRAVRQIIALGHTLALHFDPSWYETQSNEALLEGLKFEKELLERLFNVEVDAFSFHLPDTGPWVDMRQDLLAGMVNAYGNTIHQLFTYCSDSNGYWRFKRLPEVLEDLSVQRLHVLTHPEWYTPDIMSPRARITRCIEGRAKKQGDKYDELLRRCARKNVGK